MLLSCPECKHEISDKAITCPNCGYPLQREEKEKKKQNKRMRLPNGFGQITKINNQRLRNPYRVLVCVGKTADGKYQCKSLKPTAYFRTYNDAYSALIEYHKNPYDLSDDLTVKQLYDKWSESYFENIKESSKRNVTAAWSYCSTIYDMRVKDLRARHIKGCMNDGFTIVKGAEHYPSPNIKARIKSLFNIMLDYALEYEIVDKNYARTFEISKELIKDTDSTKHSHMSFTDAEMKTLWENISLPYVDVLLIQCYSGWRPGELGQISVTDVDLDNWTFRGGIKTEAGINRIVPIHKNIRHLVTDRYNEAMSMGRKYLLNAIDTQTHKVSSNLTYDKYQYRFNIIKDRLNLNPDHKAHDGRKHFITMAKKYNVDEYAIKYMVGHSITDLTERVYTDRDIAWLTEEIGKIK